MKKKVTRTSLWKGSVFFLGRERIVFIGKAGTSVKQATHALKVCIALDGDFELIAGSREAGERCSAAIINAGVVHTVKCNGPIFLLYLLPESRAARELRWEFLNNDADNVRRGVYDIPKELLDQSFPFLRQMARTHTSWECPEASRQVGKIIGGLGRLRRRRFTTSFGLSAQLHDKVRQTIDYIFKELESQVMNQRVDVTLFETPAICAGIELPAGKAEWLEKEFRRETGTTIARFFHDIQLLAALKLYATATKIHALDEETRNAAERRILEELENGTITRRQAAELLESHDDAPKGVFLMEIARALGFGAPAKPRKKVKRGPDVGVDSSELKRAHTNFGKRVKSRIGISMADLRGQTKFFSCE